jgi:predicted CXXCH cytochrome family protein
MKIISGGHQQTVIRAMSASMNLQIDTQTEARLTGCREILPSPGDVMVAFSVVVVGGASVDDRGDFRPGLRRAACMCVVLAMGLSTAAAAPSTEPAARKPTTVTQDCTTSCHASIINRKVMHGPVAQQQCLECHKYDDPREHRFKSAFPKEQPCGNCHDLKEKAVGHQPVQEGKCTACHDPHGSDRKAMLVADPAKLCAGCHEQGDFSKKQFVHAPAAAGACNACHEPHYASQPKLLRGPVRDVCVSCHKELVPKKDQTVSIHAPVKDDCTACHDPHASAVKNELREAAPDLCFSCHKNIKEALATSAVVHKVATDGGCETCHAAHFSELRHLEKQPQPEECLSCHDRVLTTADGRTLPDMAALLKDNPVHHGPIRLGSCTACHQPHASSHFRLLVADYPAEFYAPFKIEQYDLCFRCHVPDLVLQPRGTGVTLFRDGDKNLHWLHVNQQKGRTCRACHEVHASKEAFHIRESVPFGTGGWMLAINFKPAPTGGSCAPACHVERRYDNGGRPKTTPAVVLQEGVMAEIAPAPPKPPAEPVAAQSPAEFPVPAPPFSPNMFPCTGCHDPNLTVNTERRVLRKAHTDIQLRHDEQHRWCLDCHNADNRDVLRSASGEPIPFAESYRLCGQCHGDKYRDWKAGIHGKRTGEWNGRKNYLLCVNCHNPHTPRFKAVEPMPAPVHAARAE